MKRTLATAKIIDLPEEIPNDFLVLTPNPAAAARLNFPHRSLRSVAEEILNREGTGIASTLRSLHALRAMIRKLSLDQDVTAETARLRPVLSTVLRDGIDIAAMKRSGLPSAERLADVVIAYAKDLWTDKLIDGDSALWRAGEFIMERRKILVYGYFRAREHDIRFIDRLAGEGSIYILPSGPESIFSSVNRSIGWLVEQGWEGLDNERPSSSRTTVAAARFANGKTRVVSADQSVFGAYGYPDTDAEVRATLAAAKQMIVKGTTPDRIAIVSRKAADYEQTILAVAEEYGVPVCSRSKAILAETKLGNYIALILEATEADFEFATTARLLNHSYGPGLSDKNWAAARKKRACGPRAWAEAGVDLESFETGKGRTLEDWIQWLLKIIPLTLVRERSGASATELIAYQTFCDALGEVEDLNDGLEIEFSAFSNVIIELLQTVETVINPKSGGIVFHQPSTVIGGEFDHIFVVGMAEALLPAATNENVVIDFYEQRRLEEKGVRFDRPVEFPRWEALSFYHVLLAARNTITFSYPKVIDGEEKIASLYFDRLGIKPVDAQRASSIASRQEKLRIYLRRNDAENEDDLLLPARHQFAVERRRESPDPYDEYDGVIGIPIKPESLRWSASQMTKIGQCPFKWFAEKILHLSPSEEADTDLRGNVMGTLYHKTLQIAVEKALDSEPFRDSVLAGLESAFLEAESDEKVGVKGLPNWEHRRAEHLTVLRKAIESPEFIVEGSSVIATEKSFDVNWHGFRMRGSIDRVDQTPDGVIAIDYKTGAYVGKIKDENGELKTDIQLPIYSKVALESLYPGQVAAGHYFSLRQQKILSTEKAADISSYVNEVRQRLEAGDLAVDPDVAKKSCKYCEFDPLCRQGQRNARKRK